MITGNLSPIHCTRILKSERVRDTVITHTHTRGFVFLYQSAVERTAKELADMEIAMENHFICQAFEICCRWIVALASPIIWKGVIMYVYDTTLNWVDL